MVGAERFELPTLCSQSRCATRLRYAPTYTLIVTRNELKFDGVVPLRFRSPSPSAFAPIENLEFVADIGGEEAANVADPLGQS